MRLPIVLIFLAGLLNQPGRMAVAQQVADPDVARLAKVGLFAFGGVGIAAARSAGQTEYEAIMSRPGRQELLERVFEIGTLEAKSYALVGINNLNSARFKVLAAQLRSSKSAVQIARGCIIGRSTLGAIIQQIDAGEYAHYL